MMYPFDQYYLTKRLIHKETYDIYLSYAIHKPGHRVLLKIYNAECRHLDMAPEDFQYYARKFKRLSHPHIVPILDIGIEKGKPYVVSDYISAGSLRQQVERVAPAHVLLDTALALILDVGSALSYAHSQDIVHQKVKPENVFLNAQGEALLADFSLHELINESVLVCKPDDRAISYMAPEQLTGSATASSDQYALACLFYELITGKLPFTAHGLSYLQQRHTIPSPTPPSQFVTTLPKQGESVVLKALSKKPEERYADVVTFLAALEEAVRPALSTFPSKDLILHTDHQSDVRLPKEALPPTPAARLASAKAAVPKEPESEERPSSFSLLKSFSQGLDGIQKEERPSSFSLLKSFPQGSDGIQKVASVSRSSIDQRGQGVYRDVSMSSLASPLTVQPASVPGLIVSPVSTPAPAPISLYAPGNIGTGRSPSIVEGAPVPASPVSSAQPQGLPVVQRFSLGKHSYALLSVALICIVVIAFFLISNKSIIHLPIQLTPAVVTTTLSGHPETLILMVLYLMCQFLYLFGFATMLYYFTRPINWVNTAEAAKIAEPDLPKIILLYPVLRELEETMRTTFLALSMLEYPPTRYRVIAIPNSNDGKTIASLGRLKAEFPFLEILEVPPTKDLRWEAVWKAWETNPKAYWWHQGKYQKN